MKLDAIVLHNVCEDMFWRFDPRTSQLHHAHTFRDVEADNIDKAADLIWNLTNIGDANELRVNFPHLSKYADEVTNYRRRKNRSLSVGDVLVFVEGERPAGVLAVASMGFKHFGTKDVRVDLTDVANQADESLAYLAHQDRLELLSR
jgi:hypothetical protein